MEEENIVGKEGGSKKHYFYYWSIGLLILLFGFFLVYFVSNINLNSNVGHVCGDNTFYGDCSLNKPYYCEGGLLVKNVEMCGCPEVLEEKNGSCFSSEYGDEKKDISLKYIIDGEDNFVNIDIYEEFSDYLDNLPRSLVSVNGENYTRRDFKLMKIGDDLQREALMPLVIEIQNIAPSSKELQAKIATSLVQNIPYGEPDFADVFGGRFQVRLSRYPYQALDQQTGSCEGKSELLVFLLRELGFEVGLFYYQTENHEAVGIRCPEKYSLNNTGFCFIETTLPAPISYSQGRYRGVGGTSVLGDYTQFMFISEGKGLSKSLEDYSDTQSLRRLVDKVDEKGYLNFFEKRKLDYLREKYGLAY